jgi:hypothetical protein
MEDIIGKLVEDIVNGNHEIEINQIGPISANFPKTEKALSGSISFTTSEGSQKSQAKILKIFPVKPSSGQIEMEKINNCWLF